MNVQSHLDDLREGTPGCTLTAFGDLSSSLILRSSSHEALQRETLDKLCESAHWSFDVLEHIHAASASSGTEAQQVVLFSHKEATIFVRSLQEINDMICATVGPGQPLQTALNATAACLNAIEGEDV